MRATNTRSGIRYTQAEAKLARLKMGTPGQVGPAQLAEPDHVKAARALAGRTLAEETLQIATRGLSGVPIWQPATALSRGDLARLARTVVPDRHTVPVTVRKVTQRHPTTGDILTTAEYTIDCPRCADGSPDLNALPPEPPASR